MSWGYSEKLVLGTSQHLTCFLMASRSLSRTKSSLSCTLVSLVLRGSENSWKKLSSGSKLLSVCTNSIYLFTQKHIKISPFQTWALLNHSIMVRTCWPAYRRFHWEGRCPSADRAYSWILGSTWSSWGFSGRRLLPESWGCLGCLLLWLPC